MESELILRPFEGRGEGKFRKGELSREQRRGRSLINQEVGRQRCDTGRKQNIMNFESEHAKSLKIVKSKDFGICTCKIF